MLQSEVASDCGATVDILASLLSSAVPPLRQATWLLQQRISELQRMATDPKALSDAQRRLLDAQLTGGKVALAEARLTQLNTLDRLREAEKVIRNNEIHWGNAEALLIRAELLESLAEHAGSSAPELLDAGLDVCQSAVTAFESDLNAAQEHRERRIEAHTLLGDLCLTRVRSLTEGEKTCSLVAIGTRGYETAMRAAESGSAPETESETFYNMACLIVLGLAKGCEVTYQESQVGALLKRAVDAGGVDDVDLGSDEDLAFLRCKPWFAKLMGYAMKVSGR